MAPRPDEPRLDTSLFGAGGARGARHAWWVPSAEDGSADLAAELAEMGLSPKAAWYSSAVLYGGGGLLVTVLYAIDPTLFAAGVFYLGCIAVLIGALCIVAGEDIFKGPTESSSSRRTRG